MDDEARAKALAWIGNLKIRNFKHAYTVTETGKVRDDRFPLVEWDNYDDYEATFQLLHWR